MLFSGSDDPLAAPLDVDWTEKELPMVERIAIQGYGHFDFLAGLDAREKVYDEIIRRAV